MWKPKKDFKMTIDDFKSYFHYILEETSFMRLLSKNVKQDEEALNYLNNRKIVGVMETLGMDIFVFEGDFEYKGKTYNLRKSIVIPLKSPTDDLRGVMIRSIYDKQFYIWMIGENQKYWLSPAFDKNSRIYVFESIFDALSFSHLTGNHNVVALLGVSPTTELQKHLGEEVVLALDNDSAGKKNSLSLLTSNPHWGIISSNLGEIKDYNELLIKGGTLQSQDFFGIKARIYLKSII